MDRTTRFYFIILSNQKFETTLQSILTVHAVQIFKTANSYIISPLKTAAHYWSTHGSHIHYENKSVPIYGWFEISVVADFYLLGRL